MVWGRKSVGQAGRPAFIVLLGRYFQNIPPHGMRFYFRCTVELGMGDSGWIEMGEMELRSLLAFVGRGPDKDQVTTRVPP